MDFDEFLNYETFVRTFTKVPSDKGTILFINAGRSIDKLDTKALRNLIHMLYGKWPHTPFRGILVRGVKRGIQQRFYAAIQLREPNANMQRADLACVEELILKDDEYYAALPKPKKPKRIPVPREESTPLPKPKKPKRIPISREELILAARQAGMDEATILKLNTMNVGMAKMQINAALRRLSQSQPAI